jgi:hypothetical protein
LYLLLPNQWLWPPTSSILSLQAAYRWANTSDHQVVHTYMEPVITEGKNRKTDDMERAEFRATNHRGLMKRETKKPQNVSDQFDEGHHL